MKKQILNDLEEVMDTKVLKFRMTLGITRRAKLEAILKDIDVDYEIEPSMVSTCSYRVTFKCLMEDFIKVMEKMAIEPEELTFMYCE